MPRKADVPKRLADAWDKLGQGMPLDDLELQRLKAKPRAKPVQHERHAQGRAVIYLRKHLPRGSLVYAVPNHSRSRMQTFALMREGLLPGMPDLGIIVPWPEPHYHRTFRVEWKRENGGRLSESQLRVHEQLRQLGVPLLEECRTIEQCVAWLRAEGVDIQ